MSLIFDTGLYLPEAIERAVAAFSGLAEFAVVREKNRVVVSVVRFADGLSEQHRAVFPDELANHALYQSVVLGRGAA